MVYFLVFFTLKESFNGFLVLFHILIQVVIINNKFARRLILPKCIEQIKIHKNEILQIILLSWDRTHIHVLQQLSPSPKLTM